MKKITDEVTKIKEIGNDVQERAQEYMGGRSDTRSYSSVKTWIPRLLVAEKQAKRKKHVPVITAFDIEQVEPQSELDVACLGQRSQRNIIDLGQRQQTNAIDLGHMNRSNSLHKSMLDIHIPQKLLQILVVAIWGNNMWKQFRFVSIPAFSGNDKSYEG